MNHCPWDNAPNSRVLPGVLGSVGCGRASATLPVVAVPDLPALVDQHGAELGSDDEALLAGARIFSDKAFAPYSRFKVGAAVRVAGSLTRYYGCNVEDPSQAHTIHAEQAALAAAVTDGRGEPHAPIEIDAIAVFGYHTETLRRAYLSSPCGACRQLLAEFGAQMRVIFPKGAGVWAGPLADLLPERFELEDP